MESSWGIAALWMALALAASFLSIRFNLSVALVEILVGIAAGNVAHLLDHYLAGVFAQQRDAVRRLRTTVFAFLTPFYFLNAGMKVYAPALWSGLGMIAVLLLVKLLTKFAGVWPLTRLFRFGVRECNYTTLLMSTGLTFGTISALFGLQNDYINQQQYSILVTVVIGSAIVPTLIAQTFFKPQVEPAIALQVVSASPSADRRDAGATDGVVGKPSPHLFRTQRTNNEPEA